MAKNVLQEELIGLPLTVVAAKNRDLVGISGTIVDETKYTLVVRSGQKTRVLLKEQVTIAVDCKGTRVQIDGARLLKRPEKRIDTQ
jgi:ribonuclease P protein subunit POP4